MSPHSQAPNCQQQDDDNRSLDLAFDKMQKLGIPADIFGNIHPNWRVVMRKYFDQDKLTEPKIQEDLQKTIEKLDKKCTNKYGNDLEQVEDCQQQIQLRIINQFSKPKQLSEILLCNFANKCLIRGNSIQFCTEEVLKQKEVITRQCFKRLSGIQEFL